MTPSSFSSTGLSIVIKTPLVIGGEVIDNYTQNINTYTHTISAEGGYTSANFTTVGNINFVEDWLQNGLGRHIEVYNPEGVMVWEGFVNQMEIKMGGVNFSIGPLTNICNRVVVWYTPIYLRCPELGDPQYDPNCEETGEPITGTEMPTIMVNDEVSQNRYGIWEKILNIGNAYRTDAEYIRDLYLEENAYPESNPSLSISSGEGDLSVNLTCRGYIDVLNYVYTNDSPNISTWVSEIIKDILNAEPNSFLSNNYSQILDNAVIFGSQFLEDKLAKNIIDDLLALGGGDDDRWTFGIYKNRNVIYAPIPTDVEYVYYKTGTTQHIETVTGSVVEPWNVLPCKWVSIPTYLSSFSMGDNIRKDPRTFFGEEVTYTAPDQVTISGAKIRKLSQYMAKLGLGGV